MTCEGSKKGKVSFTDKGVTTEITVPLAPFFVSCNPTSSCGKMGTRTITYNVANPAAAANNGSTDSFNSFEQESVFFKAVPQPGAYDGNHYDLWGSCPDGERLIEAAFSVNSGAVNIINNVFKSDNSSGLIIKDANNNIILNIAVSQCSYQISCDNDCPQGYCKIDCEAYPGYCCLNEAEIKGLINQLNS